MTLRVLQSTRGRLLVLFTCGRSWAWRIGPGQPLRPLGITAAARPVRLPEPERKAA